MSDDLFNTHTQRERIDAHKENVMANPWKFGVLVQLSDDGLLEAWVEQMGDAELYREEWEKRNAE